MGWNAGGTSIPPLVTACLMAAATALLIACRPVRYRLVIGESGKSGVGVGQDREGQSEGGWNRAVMGGREGGSDPGIVVLAAAAKS